MSREAEESKGSSGARSSASSKGPGAEEPAGDGSAGPPRAAGRLTALFTKRPVSGEVKTRLSPLLGASEAARLAEAMLLDVSERLSRSAWFQTVLLFAPADAGGWFREAVPWLLDQRPQRGAGLAERLDDFFSDALPDGTEGEASAVQTAVVVGSDQPWLSAERVLDAHRRLEAGADLVLGPDLGGGYDLIGLRRPEPRLFRQVTMSTGDMCEATRRLAGELGLATELLEPTYDIDVPADLERLAADLASRSASALVPQRTRAVLSEFGLLRTNDSPG